MVKSIFADFARLYPERFTNVTNGVTPRRWIALANRGLAQVLDKHIGESWRNHLEQLVKLDPLKEDAAVRAEIRAVKHENKRRLAEWINSELGIKVSPDALFDVQIKRIHEYKRQLLNVLQIINRYNRILKNPIDRAASLLMTQNIDADAPEHTAFAPEFLMQQMEWRETLAEARAAGDTAALNALGSQVSAEQTALYGQLAAAFDAQQYQTAAQLVRQGRFLNKMRQEIENAV